LSSDTTRVLVASTKALFRDCLSNVLDRRREFKVIGQAGDATQAVIRAKALRPDVAVLESGAREPDPDAVRQLTDAGCSVLVIASPRADGASRVLQAGGRGYLSSDCDLQELERAIQRVHAGDVVVAARPPRHFLEEVGHEPAAERHTSLTPRELEVLRHVAMGRTNAEIADDLCITEPTTKGHIAKILSKLGLNNRTQLAAYAISHDLVEPTPKVWREPVLAPRSAER